MVTQCSAGDLWFATCLTMHVVRDYISSRCGRLRVSRWSQKSLMLLAVFRASWSNNSRDDIITSVHIQKINPLETCDCYDNVHLVICSLFTNYYFFVTLWKIMKICFLVTTHMIVYLSSTSPQADISEKVTYIDRFNLLPQHITKLYILQRELIKIRIKYIGSYFSTTTTTILLNKTGINS